MGKSKRAESGSDAYKKAKTAVVDAFKAATSDASAKTAQLGECAPPSSAKWKSGPFTPPTPQSNEATTRSSSTPSDSRGSRAKRREEKPKRTLRANARSVSARSARARFGASTNPVSVRGAVLSQRDSLRTICDQLTALEDRIKADSRKRGDARARILKEQKHQLEKALSAAA